MTMLTDAALLPPPIITNPGPNYADDARHWQGIPGIERAANGRLWAVWYSGGVGEGPDNYVVLVTSDDDGYTWSAPRLIVDPPGRVRAYDPCLWHDPLGRLWLFWAQSAELHDGRAGVWTIRCDDSGSATPAWSAPRRLCNGVMMNKPTVLSTGEWILPSAVWACAQPYRDELSAERYSNIIVSTDAGRTWSRRGGADVPERSFDEHMVVERNYGTLWILVRTRYGVGESISADRGVTWSPGKPSAISGPDSRFFLRRLRSGRLLLVNHRNFTGRTHLTASLSEDDGRSWTAHLLLDAREQVSYPDGVQAEDGRLYVIYDYNRGVQYNPGRDRQILLAVFTEEDVLAGAPLSAVARLRGVVNQARG